MEQQSCSYYLVPDHAGARFIGFDARPEEQGHFDGSFVDMLHNHCDPVLPPTPPAHISMVPEDDWCTPCSPDYLVPAMVHHDHPYHPLPPPPPQPLFYDMVDTSLTMSTLSSPHPIMHGGGGGCDVTPPSPPLSVISNKILGAVTTSTSLLALSTNNKNKKKTSAPSLYKCGICNKCFTRPYNLKSHLRTHTNERPFVCTANGCSWKFARPHDLKRHELLHSGKKPHKCSVCDKRFARRDALRRHWKVDRECGDVVEGTTSRVSCR